jgi:hypothetical protein
MVAPTERLFPATRHGKPSVYTYVLTEAGENRQRLERHQSQLPTRAVS